ncbi:MAG: 4-(cytidine 5'-diphospho)-2-C-methyl-D-erythritol kinase [Lachnospiraceae bacterium]|nr:4-(cytidine 5'-diphospho)-2-C-methyl-D-erythritol kinase [Lachnospiraceae bacterium]
MGEIILDAHAKINLGLDITGLRGDGYHLVDMVMQAVTLSDRIIIKDNGSSDIRLTSDAEHIPLDEHNLAYKAAKLMQDAFPGTGGVEIHIEKNIPVAAGLAGGSTDAAAVMTGINELFGLGTDKRKLMEMAVKLGADVPYCIFGGTARAEGIGEVVTAIRDLSECFILISKPSCSVSTAETYKRYDALTEVAHPDIEGMIRSINSGDLTGMAAKMGNVLEYVTEPIHPIIGDIKRIMRENGAISSMMSGSGPSVFGIFDDEEKLGIAKTRIEDLGLCTENHACRPV